MFLHKLFEKKLKPKNAKAAALFWAIFAFGFLFQSCADSFFPEFTVRNSYLDGQKAVVLFSAQVNPISAMKNFLFAEDERQIEGKLDFFENALIFVPNEQISENHCYKIAVYSGAQDLDGNTLQRDYQKTFYTKNDLTPPIVVQAKTLEDSEKNTYELQIFFNKEINKKSFDESFSMEPEAESFVTWTEDGKTAKIQFKAPLLERTLHSIKIEKNLKDRLNNTMLNDFYWSWTNNPCAKNPSYKVYAKEFGELEPIEIKDTWQNADFSEPLRIVFDKSVLADSVEQAIELQPKTAFEVEAARENGKKTCRSAKITFTEKAKWNSEFTLVLKGSIKDASGFCVQERKIAIKNNSEKTRPPKLECIIMALDGKNIFLGPQKNFSPAEFSIDKYPCAKWTEVPIYFIFSTSPFSKKIDRISAFEGISASATTAGTINLNTIECLEEEDFLTFPEIFEDANAKETIDFIKANSLNPCAVLCRALFKNAELNEKPAAGLIEFTASQALCDDKQNYMEETTRLTCDKI